MRDVLAMINLMAAALLVPIIEASPVMSWPMLGALACVSMLVINAGVLMFGEHHG